MISEQLNILQTNQFNLIPIELLQHKYYLSPPFSKNPSKPQIDSSSASSTFAKYKRKMLFYKRRESQKEELKDKQEQEANSNQTYQLYRIINPLLKEKRDEIRKKNGKENKIIVQHSCQKDNEDLLGSNIITIFSQYQKSGIKEESQRKKQKQRSKLPRIEINESCQLKKQDKEQLKIQSKTFQMTQQNRFDELQRKHKKVVENHERNAKQESVRYQIVNYQQLRTQSLEEKTLRNVSVLEGDIKKASKKTKEDESRLAEVTKEYEYAELEAGQGEKGQEGRRKSGEKAYDEILELERAWNKKHEKLEKRLQRNWLVKRSIQNWVEQSRSQKIRK